MKDIEKIIEDFIKVKLGKMKKEQLKKKYGIGDKKYKKYKMMFVTEYGVDPRALYTAQEIENNEELKKYCSDEKINKTIDEIKAETKIIETERQRSMFIKSQSTLKDGDGNVMMVWTKETVDEIEFQENLINSINAMTERVPSLGQIKLDRDTNPEFDNTMVFIPIADFHFNLKIEKADTSHGFEWNVDIAEKYFKDSMEYILNSAPSAKECVIFDAGDLMHAHDNTARTIKSGHVLDTDIKYESAMIRLFDLMTNLVEAALKKYETVYFYSVPGNHNDFISITLKAILKRQFKDEPRFICDLSKHVNVYYHKFGKSIIGMSHGDEVKPDRANDVLINDNIDVISDYKYYDFYFGHFHQNKFVEKGITTIRCLKPLIPNDKWADNMGFRNRNVGYTQCFVYHKDMGMTSNIMYRPIID